MIPEIMVIPEQEYVVAATSKIERQVNQAITEKGRCSLMLTGGRTAKKMYDHWHQNPPWDHARMTYLFGDERCVAPDNQESNYGMVMSSFFPQGVPEGCKVERIRGEVVDFQQEAQRYGELLPQSVDVLLLSVGADGHIASLFPAQQVADYSAGAVPITGPKPPSQRISVTPSVIQAAQTIFLFAVGEEKGRVLADALKEREAYARFPLLWALKGGWLLDEKAATPLDK